MRSGARNPLYSWQRTVPGGGLYQNPPVLANGTPEGPGCGRVTSLNWEILVPSIGPSGALANWFTTYSQYSNPTNKLPLIEWTKGLAPLGAFGKQNLLLEDFQVFLGADVTDVNASFAVTAVRTRLYADNGAGGFITAYESSAWPGNPANPAYTYITWTTAQKVLLGTGHPKVYLEIQNNDGAITMGAGRIRCYARVAEI